MSFLCFVCYGSFACSVGAALPEIADRLNTDETSLGILFTARGCGFVAGTLVYSFLSDLHVFRHRKDILIAGSVFIGGIGANVMSISTSHNTLIVSMFVLSTLFSGIDILSNIMLPNLWGLEVQPWLHALHACWSIGGIIGPLLIGWVGYRRTNMWMSVLSTVPLLILFCTPSRAPMRTDSDQPRNVILSHSTRFLFFGFYFLYVGLESGYGGWITAYAANMELTPSQGAYLASLFYFSMSIGRIISVPLSLRYQPNTLMQMQLIITVIGAFLALHCRGSGLGGASVYITCALTTVLIGYGISSIFPIGLTLPHEYKLDM
ncbi:unnamed protein product [Ectocarpus fasciculatus]